MWTPDLAYETTEENRPLAGENVVTAVVLRKLRSGTEIPGSASTYPVTPKIRWMNFT